jgi:hypothetical protein
MESKNCVTNYFFSVCQRVAEMRGEIAWIHFSTICTIDRCDSIVDDRDADSKREKIDSFLENFFFFITQQLGQE